MTKQELIECLTILKEQALKSNNDTAVINVNIDSFTFVIDSAIEELRLIISQGKTTKIEQSNYSLEEYKLDLDFAYKCGYEAAKKEQEPRKGHWKLVQRGKFIDVCCSNCEAVRIKEWAYNYTIDELTKEDINECFGSAEMRFCPNCGADMREVEE